MAFSMLSVLADPAVSTITSTANKYGLYTMSVTLQNASASSDFLLAAIRKHATANDFLLKEDLHNSYLNFYAVPALEVGVGELTKSAAEGSSAAVNRRIPIAELIQSQGGSDLYTAFEVKGLPAGYQYKVGFELVINGAAQTDWIAHSATVTMGGVSVSPPTVTLAIAEEGAAIEVTVDTADISDTPNFLLEVVDATKAAMPELDYDASVVSTSTFAFNADNKPVFTFSPATPGMRKYVEYAIRIRARKETDGQPDACSDFVVATSKNFTLPWLTDFVDQTVIKGRQVEDSLIGDLAQKILDNPASRAGLRTALNSGSYTNVATFMYDQARDVAVTEFESMGEKFAAVRSQLRRIALYSEIDASYGEMMDLTDPETNEAFAFVTKQGFSGEAPTSYYSWLDKAFHLGAVVEDTAIAKDKYYVTVRGSVYRDRAEILFS